MKQEWLTHARSKWAKEMTEARKYYELPRESGHKVRAFRELAELRAQAKALVLIERASRQQERLK